MMYNKTLPTPFDKLEVVDVGTSRLSQDVLMPVAAVLASILSSESDLRSDRGEGFPHPGPYGSPSSIERGERRCAGSDALSRGYTWKL